MNSPSDNRLTSERFAEFSEALEVLYIKGNISGRNQFSTAWPDAAQYIFGEELMGYDREGAPDKERRTLLEQEAEDRRSNLLATISTIEEKCVDKGVLQVEYVQKLLSQLERKLSLIIFSRWLVDRFIPPSAEEGPAQLEVSQYSAPEVPTEDAKPAPPPAAPAAERPTPTRSNSMDHIKPISVDQEQSPPVPPEEELIIETQGGQTTIPTATVQESFAPVLGGGEKKPGLKILSIAETEPDADKKPE